MQTLIWYENPAELAARRKEFGLSQAKLAKLAGMSRSTLRDVESGRIKLQGERMRRLWEAISEERDRSRICSNALAARFLGLRSERQESVAVDISEVIDAARKTSRLESEVVSLRDRLAEMAVLVDKLSAAVQKAVGEQVDLMEPESEVK